ncbi:MAG: 50S ribosomal protein L21 [Chloroflexi bacterium]|nr:50S ribosomal protein L21 [Chloroflexota bacterium]
MKYAIVQSGGKQFRAVEGGSIEVDLLEAQPGESVSLSDVLLVADGEQVTVGAPTVAGASVETTVLGHLRAPKIVVFKYKPKERYRVKTGHRQNYTRLQVERIIG